MAKAAKKEAEQHSGDLGVYIIEGGRPNRRVRRPNAVPEIVQLKQDDEEGKLYKRFPKCRSPRYNLGITPQLLKKADEAGVQANAMGTFVTRDLDDAVLFYRSVKSVNPDARVSELSLPLPENCLDGVRIPSNNY